MFSIIPAIVVAVMIDRLCTRHRLNSTPYQFASLGLAMGGEFLTIGILDAVFPRPISAPIAIDNTVAEAIGWTIAALCGLAASLSVYILLRARLLKDKDYDDEVRRPRSDIADIIKPRDRDDVFPE